MQHDADDGSNIPDGDPRVDTAEQVRPLHRLRVTYRVILLWTLCYGAMSWLVEWGFSQLDHRSAHAFLFGLSRMVYAVWWGAAAVVAVVMTDWRPITNGRQYGRMLLHLAVCLVVVVVWGVLAYYTNLLIVPGWQALGIGMMLASTSKNVLFGYGVLLVLVHVVWWVRRHRMREISALQQQQQITMAQLQVLKMELQPHFLFNALNSVSALIERDPRAANEVLVRISDMLRHAVRTSRVQVVPLREELRTLQLYTDIEQTRFEDRLRMSWDVPEELGDMQVPHMLLQPLVENAIKYAIEPSAIPGHVELRAREIAGPDGNAALELTLRDDGPGPRVGARRSGMGVGIANTQARLRQLYGHRQSFDIGPAPEGGTVVRIVVPARQPAAGQHTRHAGDLVQRERVAAGEAIT